MKSMPRVMSVTPSWPLSSREERLLHSLQLISAKEVSRGQKLTNFEEILQAPIWDHSHSATVLS